MTLEQWTSCCAKAINANFRIRNLRVYGCNFRHQRILKSRRNQVRRWIAELRLATNPATAQATVERVRWAIN